MVATGGSFGVNPLRLEIGLGAADTVVTLEVYWPTSNRRQRFTDVAADRYYGVRESSDKLEPRELKPVPFRRP